MDYSLTGPLSEIRFPLNLIEDTAFSQFWNGIGKEASTLQRCATSALVPLVAYRWLPASAQSSVASWVNSAAALSCHRQLPVYLQSKKFVEAAWVMVSLYNFEKLISKRIPRPDEHFVDDLNGLVNGEWVWSRTRLIPRMTKSVAGVMFDALPSWTADQELKCLARILRFCFPRARYEGTFFDRFWASRSKGESHQRAFCQMKEWATTPYQPFVNDDGPLVCGCCTYYDPRMPEANLQ